MAQQSVGKVIDKYRVQSIFQRNTNGATIMRAVNIETGEHLVIKKAVIPRQGVSLSNLPESEQSSIPALLYNEVSIIKEMNIPRIVRCLQMIKSKRSLYLVYQNYPQLTLEKYLKERGPIPALKIRFAQILCEILQEIHRKGYIYVNLMPSSIYVITGTKLNPNSYDLKFVGFQHAKKIKAQGQQTEISKGMLQQSQYLAPQILKKGFALPSSDIYSAGKIFQLLGLNNIKNKQEINSQILTDMLAEQPEKRPTIDKVWKHLKDRQSESKLFDHSVLQLEMPSARNKSDTYSTATKARYGNIKIQKRNIQEEERRLKKIVKIRTLVIYLHDLANFALSQKNKTLFYLLLKKSVIIRVNLIHQIKKMLQLYSGEHCSRLNSIKQILTVEQTQVLNMMPSIQQSLKNQNHPLLLSELQNRNQLNQKLIQEQICEFVCRKKEQIKPFHSILDEKQRSRLIYLCSLAQKLVYGSFQKFFDEVVDDSQAELRKQKYFCYLKSATTKQIVQRLEKILKQRNR